MFKLVSLQQKSVRRVALKDTSILNQFFSHKQKNTFHLRPKIPAYNGWYVVSSFKQCFFNEKDEKETLIEKDELNEETFDGFFEL